MPAPVIDFHVHVLPWDTLYVWIREWMQIFVEEPLKPYLDRVCTPEGTLAMMDEAGVDYGVVLAELSPITSGMIISSEETVEFCRDHPRLIPFANINPYLTTTPAQDLERYAKEMGVRGVKILPTYHHFYPNDKLLYPIYAAAQEMGLPAMFHTGSSVFQNSRTKFGDPLFLEDVALDFPDLAIVMSHSGRGFWTETAAYLARTYENVYMEIAGLPPTNLLKYFPDLEEMANKVIFGSDWPSQPFMKRNVRDIKELPISASAKAKILGGTAARLLGLPIN
ncbi:MAG: amidohydrolase family protein [Dehalococcoidia bacterium]|nr:amidohydrolase family protein [Dehalococcoidia bacterium]